MRSRLVRAGCSGIAVLIALLSAAAVDMRAEAPQSGSWTGTWSAAMAPGGTTAARGLRDITLRQIVHVSLGGERVRLRISNAYGTAPLTVGAVTVAPGGFSQLTAAGAETDPGPGSSPQVDPVALRPVSFGGAASLVVPAGAEWLSDPVELSVAPNSDLVVSMYLPGVTGEVTWHASGRATSYRADGDATADSGAQFTPLGTARYFLAGVDVISRARGSVVFFGDSLTDGVGTTIDANRRYPDHVADRLLALPEAQQCGVLNAGISGNMLLADAGRWGAAATARFPREVLARSDVRTVVLLHGINDIGRSRGSVTADALISGYRQLIAAAHDADIRIVGATLLPYEGSRYFSAEGEAVRLAVNAWIRTSGEFDAVVDLDATLRDPAQPARLSPQFHVGDHLHLNDMGSRTAAGVFELSALC